MYYLEVMFVIKVVSLKTILYAAQRTISNYISSLSFFIQSTPARQNYSW